MKTVAVLSGRGSLPLQFKKLSERLGYKTYTVGVKGITDFEGDFKIPFLGFVEFEELLERLNRPKIVLLGKFDQRLPFLVANSLMLKLKAFLFGGNLKRNFQIFNTLRRRAKSGQPEGLIRAFMEHLEERGFSFLPSGEIYKVLKPLFAERGNMTPAVDFNPERLYLFFEYAKRIADMDIGQTLVVKERTVVAVEGIEGTNEAIKRACRLAGKGFVAVKVARTNQDYRVDIPAVGMETLKLLRKCRAKALLLEAGKVLIADKERFLKEAQRAKIAVIGLTPR